jgi:hypothetical protein
MRPSSGIAVALLALGITALPAFASQWGTFTLQPRETQMIRIDASAVELRVCNDTTSKGRIAVTVGGNDTRLLRPGFCAEDIGDRILASNQGDGPAFGTYGLSYGSIRDRPTHFRSHH